jgi:hypothetical protein
MELIVIDNSLPTSTNLDTRIEDGKTPLFSSITKNVEGEGA